MNKKEKLQPKVVAPVARPTTGSSIFNAQPNGGVEASVPVVVIMVFGADDAE